MNEWLDKLHPGDKVIVGYMDYFSRYKVATVTARTPHYLIVDDMKFSRVTGEHPVPYGSAFQIQLHPWTAEREAEITAKDRRGWLISQISKVKWCSLNDDTLEAVYKQVTHSR